MTEHAPTHSPTTGTGYQVCDCGATRRVENGVPVGAWHACLLCTHPNFHKKEGDMNYPKIGPVRVFAMDKIIHIIDANGGKPFLFNHTEARELAKALNVLADAIYNPKKEKQDNG